MAYPTFTITQDSTAETNGGLEPQRASNGMLRLRRLYSQDKTEFNVVHELTAAERDTLRQFWIDYRTAAFTFTWPLDGQTYTVCFLAAPQYSRTPTGYRADVRLGEV